MAMEMVTCKPIQFNNGRKIFRLSFTEKINDMFLLAGHLLVEHILIY